jgi:phosphoribosylformylglycinamidine synthase
VGLLSDYHQRADFSGLKDGEALILIGETRGVLGASLYLREVLGREEGAPPPVDLALERRHGDFVRKLIKSGQVKTVHDLSDGGLAAAAVDVALASNLGLRLDNPTQVADHGFFFGEDQGRYLVALPAAGVEALLAAAQAANVAAAVVGQAGGHAVTLAGQAGALVTLGVDDLRKAHEAWLPRYMAELV